MNISDTIRSFNDVSGESFTLSCSIVDDRICLKLAGKVDIQNPDELLLPALLKLDKDFIESKVHEIGFNIKELEFINSSGIKVILQLVMGILNRHGDQQYKIIFYHNPESKYQKKSFNAISFLAPALISFVP
ncbi:MAG TPA: hypothetical protein PLT75_17820 [Spirochaetota bacterium]|nr:hypothetical protein [Spirochaetota bacterium]